MKGKFIVIEGIDGCGKTTQIDELSKWLPNSGLIKKGSKLITTREPGGSLFRPHSTFSAARPSCQIPKFKNVSAVTKTAAAINQFTRM